MTRKQLLLARILFVLYLIAVVWLCFGHFNAVPKVQRAYWGIPTDKIVHFCMFFPFPLLAWLAFDRYTETFWSSFGYICLTFMTGCLIAAGTEVGQSFTDYRSGDRADFLADLLALASSSLIVFLLDIRKQRKPCTEKPS
ncbi:MAG: VanZ family protein [Bacteroidales bacterium]|nr:VanZ family protein [Bacteroidales bacterium]